MRRSSLCAALLPLLFALGISAAPLARRLVILKIDGLGQSLLEEAMQARDPATGKSQLPWLTRIFAEQGVIYENFYSRGISLSAPSWGILDTGRHSVIRANVEFDRYTGEVYDYLNFFPFYIGYARQRAADMPAVAVLDRAGIPLMIDAFKYPEVFQSFQLFQRGVRWTTLQETLKKRFSSEAIISTLEGDSPSYDSLLYKQTEKELIAGLKDSGVLYLDFYTGAIDHEGHATSEHAALIKDLREVDALAGRVWTAIQTAGMAKETLLVLVSDHGMNNVPGVVSQTYSVPDLLNSPAGGAHHVVTDREQLSDYKLKGLDPLVHRVVTPSNASSYLAGEASRYPTAWLDIDGNERASLQLRNSDLNRIHILTDQLRRADLPPNVRKAAAAAMQHTIDAHRAAWARIATDMQQEVGVLKEQVDSQTPAITSQPKRWKKSEMEQGLHRDAFRTRQEYLDMTNELAGYTKYLGHLRRLLDFEVDSRGPLKIRTVDLVPEMSLGDPNTYGQLRHYLAGLGPAGLVLTPGGTLNEEASFQYIDYPALFAGQRALNRPQAQLASNPVDFTMLRLGDPEPGQHAYWLYRGENSQIVILTNAECQISVLPVSEIKELPDGRPVWTDAAWHPGLPLELFEDSQLKIPFSTSRAEWLSGWHSEKEWLAAIHKTRYSTGVIGVIEELSPVGDNVPARPDIGPIGLRLEKRRRELVQADLHIFAADHWNFNVRFPNPGGNHGSFFRISTHSVWMMAGAGLEPKRIEEPADGLEFTPTLLRLLGK